MRRARAVVVDALAMVEGSEEKTPIGIETSDPSSATFTLHNEDHTMGNAVRYMLNKMPEVTFAGYSVPHPSEPKLNIRLQTVGEFEGKPVAATQTLHNAFRNVYEIGSHVLSTFDEAINDFKEKQGDTSGTGPDSRR